MSRCKSLLFRSHEMRLSQDHIFTSEKTLYPHFRASLNYRSAEPAHYNRNNVRRCSTSHSVRFERPDNFLIFVYKKSCYPLVTVTGQRAVLNLRSLDLRPGTMQFADISDSMFSLSWPPSEHVRTTNHHESSGSESSKDNGGFRTASTMEMSVMNSA